MKFKTIFLSFLLIFILISCIQKSNQSRQFKRSMEIRTLSADGKEITVNIISYYQFKSEESKPFDEKGYFIDEKENGDYLIEPIIRSATRSVIGRYTPTELSLKDKVELENLIHDSTNFKEINSDKRNKIHTQINHIILENVIFSKSAKESISNNQNIKG